MNHITYVDRGSAHSIWRLMDPIACTLLKRGWKVTYFRMIENGALAPPNAPPGIEVVDVHVREKRYPWELYAQLRQFDREFAQWGKESKPDLVHTNFCIPGNSARRIAKRDLNAAVVTTCHEMFTSLNFVLKNRSRQTRSFADAIVYISKAVAKSYGISAVKSFEVGSVRYSKDYLIYNGIDTEGIQARLERGFGVHDEVASESPVLVSVGRLVPEKGHASVVQALPQLRERFPGLRYRILGDGPEMNRLKSLAADRGVESAVEFLGWVEFDEAIRQMAQASAVVMPSRSVQEGFGLALAEAMLCGVPIVATDICVFREVAGDASEIQFFSEGDHQSLQASIETSLSTPLSAESVASQRRSVTERFAVDKMVDAYIELYQQVFTHNELNLRIEHATF